MYVHAHAPCRIGIAGGGSDLPAWTRTRPGRCLSLAIAAHTHVVAITRPDRQVVAVYRQRDSESAATEIANGLIRESALAHGWVEGFEVHTLSEMSSRGSGLGVSSSFAVSLAAAFARMRWLADGSPPPPQGTSFYTGVDDPADIAADAWQVEIGRLLRPIGRQDHMAAAWGGLRLYAFDQCSARVERTFSPDDAAWLAERLLLVQLRDGHDARTILSSVQRAAQVQLSYEAVDIALRGLQDRSVAEIGRALDHCHISKKSIPGAVPRSVAEVVDGLRVVPGVWGAKVAGAGGGGHVVLACAPGAASAVRAAAGDLRVIEVRADLQGVRSEGWQ